MPRQQELALYSSFEEEKSEFCVFCGREEENSIEFGKKLTYEDVTVHHFCLLLSANLKKTNEDDSFELFGFSVEDVKKEIARAAKLTCVYCKTRGANMGCWIKQCRKSFHLPCAISHQCVYEFVEPFKSFCHTHFDSNTYNTSDIHDSTEICGICRLEMGMHSAVTSIQTICCTDKTWYHKLCLKKTAFAFMDEFACPSCGDVEYFQENMLFNGINVPKGDYLPNYDSVEDIEAADIVPAPKRRRIHKNWIHEKTFASKQEALDALKLGGCWSFYYTNKSEAGKRDNFRCNSMKFRGKQCAAGRYLLYDSRNSNVHLYRSEEPHSHDDEECIANAVNIIPAETDAEIRRLFELHTKPKAILYNLVINGFSAPSKSRLTTFLPKIRKEAYGDEKLNYGTLHKWLVDCSKIPSSDTEPFIVNFDINIDDSNDENNEFRFFASSKMLLKTAVGVDNLHTDATYKLIWQGFPVLLVGTTDSDRRFHMIGLSVSTYEREADFEFIFSTIKNTTTEMFVAELKPKSLIADAAFSISNGYAKVFGDDDNVIMCWAHLRRAVSKKLSEFIRAKKKQNEFLFDLDKLQLARSKEIFEIASKLSITKWREISNDLADYFTHEWLIHHPNWYEGFRKKTPSHNNALESTNKVIKDEQTFQERLDISQFRFVLFNFIKQLSVEYDKGLNSINRGDPDIELKMWTDGYNFARSNTKITTSRRGNRTKKRCLSKNASITLQTIIY